MPRYAIISDIHANLDAFEAVADDLGRCDVDLVVCLGDVVGYGPDPGACVDLAMDVCDTIVVGNHDLAAISDDAMRGFNDRARAAIHYTRRQLAAHHLRAIESWPERASLEALDATHGSFGPNGFEYVTAAASAARAFDGFDAPFGAIGHTHVPIAFVAHPAPVALALDGDHFLDDERTPASCVRTHRLLAPVPHAVAEGWRALINPGSVGQPRDRNPDAAWALLDTDARTVRVRRVAYDVERVADKIRLAGLPERLAQRLSLGA